MKIAFVADEKLPVPAVLGGAVQIYISGVLPYLSRIHDITVFSGACPELPQEETRGNIRYIRHAARPGRYMEAVKARLDGSYDLVHIFNRPLWLLSLYESHPGLNYSLSLHNDMFRPDRMTRQEVHECVQKARFITAVSKYIADRIISACPYAVGKTHVIYSGVDTCMYKPASGEYRTRAEKDRLKADIGLEGYKLVLSVGRLCPEKGIHVLIRAMKLLMEERDGIALMIAGSGVSDGRKPGRIPGGSRIMTAGGVSGDALEKGYVRSIKELSKDLKGPVIFTGFLPPDRLAACYAMADVFVLPSQWEEPLARVLYEAMAAGLPVVATDRGGNAEVVADMVNGIVVREYNDCSALAQAVGLLLDDPDRSEKMGRAGLAMVTRYHSWARVADELDRLFSPASSA